MVRSKHRLIRMSIDQYCIEVYGCLADAANQQYDHVVVATKAVPDLITTPTLLAPLLTPPYSDKYSQPVYVLLQNG